MHASITKPELSVVGGGERERVGGGRLEMHEINKLEMMCEKS